MALDWEDLSIDLLTCPPVSLTQDSFFCYTPVLREGGKEDERRGVLRVTLLVS